MIARQGFFVSFEGGDGAGKSTQIHRLADLLRRRGSVVRVTREPGGSAGAEAIRKLLVAGETDRWSPLAEALLMYAARADHLDRTIRPALEAGEIVITDRFADSTMAYQGIAGGVGEDRIKQLHDLIIGDDDPDLTVILDVPTDLGLSRAGGRGDSESRFERKGAAFHIAVREAFLKIARDNPARCVVIDAANDVNAVAADVAAAFDAAWHSRR